MCAVKTIVDSIKTAWSEAEYSDVIDSALRAWTPHPEEREARDLFWGKPWDTVSDEVLEANCPSPFLIGDIPCAYYLGAFLLTALKDTDGLLFDFLVRFHLKPPRKPDKLNVFSIKFIALTKCQREAVANFLRFARDNCYESNSRARSQINDALDRYWDRNGKS